MALRTRRGPDESSWDNLQSLDNSERIASRDVYDDQQILRSRGGKVKKPTVRRVIVAVVGLLVMFATWCVYSGFQFMFDVVGHFASDDTKASKTPDLAPYFSSVSFVKIIFTLAVPAMVCSVLYMKLMNNLRAQNLMNDPTDINPYVNDQHIALPEELQRKFSWFPDAGAHSSVQVSSMISHNMISNKGLKKIQMARRADKDIYDEDGDLVCAKGDILTDDQGHTLYDTVPMIDTDFSEALFDASGAVKDKSVRVYYDASKIEYNIGNKNRDRMPNCNMISDLINMDWELPDYEPQRPGGAYLVDESPVNTMVLAITRGGKGQTVIEPTIDMWMREKDPHNMVINDPKGELLVKNYVRATLRGFQVVQFNLINPMKTDIYNPLGLAADAAREGDTNKCAQYVENIADVFFPAAEGEDPVWSNSANNAFKRAAFGLIDYYLEEEQQLRDHAIRVLMDPTVLETKLDQMWGKVTLYNCYQLFVQLSSKRVKSPMTLLNEKKKSGELDPVEDAPLIETKERECERREKIWEGKPEMSMLDLYFSATEYLPENSQRRLVMNAHNSLRAMGDAEKMLASVYGIAITAMSFFTDPTISMLTSGTPSQNTDLGGLSFPRRMGVRFSTDYLELNALKGLTVEWEAYSDPEFTQSLGEDFKHSDLVSPDGWARYFFKGIFPNDEAWIVMRLVNPQTDMRVKTMRFHFKKSYQTTLNGRSFVTDPVTGEKIVKNGTLNELLDGGKGTYVMGHSMFARKHVMNPEGEAYLVEGESPMLISTMVKYAEKPKMVFLVTPPHLMKYAKLILILLKQLVDLNFEQSYMTKNNQKPLYKTRFMLDELGNLQSEGHGISGFETMLSIGLGQDQQFTIILQTLQQLRDVYGESVDKIVQGNIANIIFLKSTDNDMIKELEDVSGKTHEANRNSKSVTQDMNKQFNSVEGKVTYTTQTEERPVIQYNDMAFITERNSIVFQSGDSPIWNRNQMILPMSWKLFSNTITNHGREYSLRTIPSLSTAPDFDIRKNQPDFKAMLERRMLQAERAEEAQTVYSKVHDMDDMEIRRLVDPDVYSTEIMSIINSLISHELSGGSEGEEDEDTFDPTTFDDPVSDMGIDDEQVYDNQVYLDAEKAVQRTQKDNEKLRYANGQLSRADLVSVVGQKNDGTPEYSVNHSSDHLLTEVFYDVRAAIESDGEHFMVRNGSLYGSSGRFAGELFMEAVNDEKSITDINDAAHDESSAMFADDDIDPDGDGVRVSYKVHDALYEFLVGLDSWTSLADGEFDRAVAKRVDVSDVA